MVGRFGDIRVRARTYVCLFRSLTINAKKIARCPLSKVARHSKKTFIAAVSWSSDSSIAVSAGSVPRTPGSASAPSVATAYLYVYQLERACMYQLLAVAGGGEMQLIPEDIAAAMAAQMRNSTGHGHWDGMKRWIEAIEPDFMN